MLVVGEKEMADAQVAVRKHGEGDKGAMPLDEFVADIKALVDVQMLGSRPAAEA